MTFKYVCKQRHYSICVECRMAGIMPIRVRLTTRVVGTRRTETASGWTRLIGTRLTESRLVGMTPMSPRTHKNLQINNDEDSKNRKTAEKLEKQPKFTSTLMSTGYALE